MNKTETALKRFEEGYVCAQAVLSVYAEEFGLEPDTALKISTAFGGGIARTAQICGAVTGALMVIGLKHGLVSLEDSASKEKTYQLSKDLMDLFAKQYGSLQCRTLLEIDISSDDGLQKAKEQELFTTRCPNYIRSVMEFLEKSL